MTGGPVGLLPNRPLTVGELLDAATGLLRARALPLLGLGLLLACLEQVLVAPLWTSVPDLPGLFEYDESPAPLLLWLIAGLTTESLALGLLGILAARGAAAELGGTPGRTVSALGAAVVVAVLAGIGAAFCGLFWLPVYALLGLAVPAVVLDQVGAFRGIGRSAGLVWASRMRAGGIRLLGYGAWFGIRVAFAYAATLLVTDLGGLHKSIFVTAGSWALINAIAYPSLACLDAVLHVENRMRVEGLDIELGRAARNGAPADSVLRVAR